jgi:hypothetical protein
MNHRTQNPKELAEIPIHVVAGIAAQIQPADGPAERIQQAYDLLDAAESARQSLKVHGSTNEGLEQFRFYRLKEERLPVIIAEYKSDPLYQEKDGRAAAVPFEKALSIVFGKSIKKTDREKRLELYLTEKEEGLKCMFSSLPPELNPFGSILRRPNAGEKFLEWKTEGIPWVEYQTLKKYLPEWWTGRLSRLQSAKRKGKTKDETKDETKGQQGRVVRRGDKRKGSSRKKTLRKKKKNP